MEKLKCKVITSPIMMLTKGERSLEALLKLIKEDNAAIKELLNAKMLHATSSNNYHENMYGTKTDEAWGIITDLYIENNDIYADVELLPEKKNYSFIKEKSKTVSIDLYMGGLAAAKQFSSIKITMFYATIG